MVYYVISLTQKITAWVCGDLLMFKLAIYLLGAGLIAGSTTVAAGELPPEILDSAMTSCRADYQRVCAFVAPGEERARCLLDHEPELSPHCLRSLKFAYALEVCIPDYRRFCYGVPPGGGRILDCLASRVEALAPECQRVVDANAFSGGHGRAQFGSYRGPYGGPGPNGGPGMPPPPPPEAYRYQPRPPVPAPYPPEDRDNGAYDGRYAEHSGYGRPREPYGDGRAPDQGDPGYARDDQGYQQPQSSYPPQEDPRMK